MTCGSDGRGIDALLGGRLRLVVLLRYSVDVYVAVNLLTAAPFTVGLMAWSFWYGLRGLRRIALSVS